MKQKKWKIGTQRRRQPFPVVNLRFRPGDVGERCAAAICQSMEFSQERPKAAFLVQVCTDARTLDATAFTEKERGEVLWEKAYRDQLAGKEPEPIASPICAQCTAFTIMRFLNQENEQKALRMIAAAVTTGRDIILFDRNLSRERTDPACAVGTFDTLADFRRHYWQQVGVER
jgi:hypothetical protein